LHAVLAAARQTGAEQLWSNRDRIGRAGRILRSRSLTREKCARRWSAGDDYAGNGSVDPLRFGPMGSPGLPGRSSGCFITRS